jgi:hypothetical protein
MKATYLGLFSLLLGLMAFTGVQSQAADAPSKLKVHVTYTGAGAVDDKHKVFVVLWDTPDFVGGGGAMPVEMQSLTAKDGFVTFEDVKKTPAYVSVLYDASGAWDAQSAPPAGCSLGMYDSKTPGQPAPIDLKPGATVAIDVSFDDSHKM